MVKGDIEKFKLKYIVSAAILIGLYLTTYYNFLLFHTLSEFFSIAIAGAIFALVWAAQEKLEFKAFLFLGIAYLFIGFIDLIHTLSYSGMGIIVGHGTNLPTQLWIGARYMQALTFLIFPFIINSYKRFRLQFLVYAAFAAGFFLSIFYFDIFPAAFIEGTGLTSFKVISEYVIVAVLVCALLFMWKKKSAFPQQILKLLTASVALTIASELFFTQYAGPYDTANVAGHYFKIAAFYFIYKAVVENGIRHPTKVLFNELDKTRRQFKNQRDRIFNVLESVQSGIYIVSIDHKIEYVNPALKNEFGESAGKLCYQYCFDRQEVCPWCKNSEVFAGKDVKWDFTYPDGRTFEFQETLLENPDGTKSKLKIFNNITENKNARNKAKKKIKEQNGELDNAYEELDHIRRLSDIGELASIVAHELRNPLATMKTSLYNLAQKTDSKELLKHMDRIKGKIKESDQIIDNLLFYSKIKPPQFKEIDIAGILSESIKTTQEKYYRKNIKFNKKINLPDRLNVRGDYIQVAELFSNLLGNAAQAVDEEGGRIDVEMRKNENNVEITIKDNGSGIDADVLDKVRQPFFTTRSSGTGLGLAVCDQIAKLHNAALIIDSAPGEGTAITIKFPLSK